MTTDKKIFVFDDFFFNHPGISVDGNSSMKRIRNANKTPKQYVSIENLKPAFDLNCQMSNMEIIAKLGGEEKLRANIVDPSQIAQLIENQWNEKSRDMNQYGNIFYVIGEDNQLYEMYINFHSFGNYWRITAFNPRKFDGGWGSGVRVFDNLF